MDDEFKNLINRFRDFPVIERKPSFLEIARYPHRETVWRNIFAFFFDPNECHGFKDLFLRSFFDALAKQYQGAGNFDSITVRTECWTHNGKYLDLLITCDEFAIGIEMKVNANLYNDLKAYGKLVKARCPDDEHKVVLSVRHCSTYDGFTNLLFSDLVPAIKNQLGNYVLEADPKYMSLLSDFLNHITNYSKGYAMTINPKQLQFVLDNFKTVQHLVKTHNEIHHLLEGKMAQINNSIAALDILKKFVTDKKPLFRCKEYGVLSKIKLEVGSSIVFWYQFNITSDYCNGTHFWIEKAPAEYGNLYDELKAAGFTSVKFALSESVEDIVATVGKTILSMIAFLTEKQTTPTAQ